VLSPRVAPPHPIGHLALKPVVQASIVLLVFQRLAPRFGKKPTSAGFRFLSVVHLPWLRSVATSPPVPHKIEQDFLGFVRPGLVSSLTPSAKAKRFGPSVNASPFIPLIAFFPGLLDFHAHFLCPPPNDRSGRPSNQRNRQTVVTPKHPTVLFLSLLRVRLRREATTYVFPPELAAAFESKLKP